VFFRILDSRLAKAGRQVCYPSSPKCRLWGCADSSCFASHFFAAMQFSDTKEFLEDKDRLFQAVVSGKRFGYPYLTWLQ
jgi:hypothetical protein